MFIAINTIWQFEGHMLMTLFLFPRFQIAFYNNKKTAQNKNHIKHTLMWMKGEGLSTMSTMSTYLTRTTNGHFGW